MYRKQREAIFCEERISCIEASTKSGKTIGCLFWILEMAIKGGRGHNYWWVAPINDQADIAFRRAVRMVVAKLPSVAYKVNYTRRTLEFVGRGCVWFKSGDDSDSLYGEDVYGAVIDEASRVKEDSWTAVRTTLTATRGPVRIIGNVVSRANWFARLSRKAEVGELPNAKYTRITWRDAVEAGVIAAEEVEEARRTLKPHEFSALYEAVALEQAPGALWSYSDFERTRLETIPMGGVDPADFFVRIVVAIDPGDLSDDDRVDIDDQGRSETGIVVVGRGVDERFYVLADLSGHYTADGWARAAVERGYDEWVADTIVAEANQGGKLVRANIHAFRQHVPVVLVRATRGKFTRAEPVATLYRRGVVHHVGYFDELEQQQTLFTPRGKSPADRMDALVWGITHLMDGGTELGEGVEIF